MSKKGMPRFSQILLAIAAIFSTIMAGLFGSLYFVLYWPYRNKFNELGRYFDEENSVVYEESASTFLLPMVFFIVLTLLAVAVGIKRYRDVTKPINTQP
ncbi:hypothetical protein [Pectobacterium wasabiae]|uniref:Uncharacterized protein n=1 Tax=Pectobacterium wasabiae TaxID=55208 RepID=A0AAW3EGK6_9GAMM|nr:hypothetical protein [Pectobacterium wasabiae]AOR65776.1 hypothetical protein A7983_21420 [Pectobacterium wasabiae CFBP 3304]EJS94699.1 Hypothetical protein Y17_2031 [Pectobacterium wasabiae CFBP 3304]KFX05490.1 hypothetical protein JV38_12400 [Pectobacterium wasabiae]KGA30343.1 hypothetical protein KU73_00020 [Pectobacterium wasabiae]